MSFFVYDDEKVQKKAFGGFPADIEANVFWEKHLENHFLLNFFLHNSKIAQERIQAGKEIDIAEKRMKFWERHPTFNKAKSEAFLAATKRKWKVA